MRFSTSPVIGTIVIQPREVARDLRYTHEVDDSSLEALLASLVQGPLFSGRMEGESMRLVTFGRFSRFAQGEDTAVDVIRADLTRLADDLGAEYERLAIA